MVTFDIPGCPVPWAASRIGKRGAMDPRSKDKINITWHIKLQRDNSLIKYPLKGPLKLTCIFYMQIPHTTRMRKREAIESGLMHHTGKPDLTNLCKLYEDMLQRAGLMDNDSQVVETHLYKFYGEKPHTLIRLEQVLGTPKDLCHL